jgi:hypothetical protein
MCSVHLVYSVISFEVSSLTFFCLDDISIGESGDIEVSNYCVGV